MVQLEAARNVSSVIALSNATYRKMLQNLAWAAGYNVIAIPLAAGVLAPIGFVLPPAIGAVLMSLSTIVVALNAQLLRRIDLTPEALTDSTPTDRSERTPATTTAPDDTDHHEQQTESQQRQHQTGSRR